MPVSSLVFDGSTAGAPCFFDEGKLFAPPPPPPDFSKIPNSSLASPSQVPHNDDMQMKQVNLLSKLIHPPSKPLPGSCLQSPPGFVCGPFPAAPGDIVKCVPQMKNSDLNQLSARVLPLTVSTVNKELENPARADPRFELFPHSYPAALSRCCAGVLSRPTDIKPLSCGSPAAVNMRLMPNPKQHYVDPVKLGFRSDPHLMAQLKILNNQYDAIKQKNLDHIRARDRIWDTEALKAGIILPNLSTKFSGFI